MWKRVPYEFLPMYSSNTKGCVRDTNTDRYIDSVIVPPGTALDEALGFVSIDFEKLGRFMPTEGFDLLSLVRLADAALRLQSAFIRTVYTTKFCVLVRYQLFGGISSSQ